MPQRPIKLKLPTSPGQRFCFALAIIGLGVIVFATLNSESQRPEVEDKTTHKFSASNFARQIMPEGEQLEVRSSDKEGGSSD